jgi:hypothetical protein
VFGGDESYDREQGNGPAGGMPQEAPRDPETPGDAESVEMPAPEPTGDERVDAVLARFDDLAGTPVAGHVEVFEDVQRRLQDVLASVDHEEVDHEEVDHEGGNASQDRPGPPSGQP